MDLKSLFMQQGQPSDQAPLGRTPAAPPPMDPPAPSPYNLYGYGDPSDQARLADPAPPPPGPPEQQGPPDPLAAPSPYDLYGYGAEPGEPGADPRLMDRALKAAEHAFQGVMRSAGSQVRELGQEIGPRAQELGDEARDLGYQARQGASLTGHQALQAGKDAWNNWFHPQGNEPDYLIRPQPGQTQSPRRR